MRTGANFGVTSTRRRGDIGLKACACALLFQVKFRICVLPKRSKMAVVEVKDLSGGSANVVRIDGGSANVVRVDVDAEDERGERFEWSCNLSWGEPLMSIVGPRSRAHGVSKDDVLFKFQGRSVPLGKSPLELGWPGFARVILQALPEPDSADEEEIRVGTYLDDHPDVTKFTARCIECPQTTDFSHRLTRTTNARCVQIIGQNTKKTKAKKCNAQHKLRSWQRQAPGAQRQRRSHASDGDVSQPLLFGQRPLVTGGLADTDSYW